MTQEEKLAKFKKLAKERQFKNETALKLKAEFFGEVSHHDLKTIYDNGFLDDIFTLSLFVFAEAYHEELVKQNL